MEKTRHFLLLRERLGDSIPKSLSDSLSPSLSSGTLSTSTSISSQISTTTFESAITPSESSGYDSADIESLVDREKELATKVRPPFPWPSVFPVWLGWSVRFLVFIFKDLCFKACANTVISELIRPRLYL